jgi:hypothetical protein
MLFRLNELCAGRTQHLVMQSNINIVGLYFIFGEKNSVGLYIWNIVVGS